MQRSFWDVVEMLVTGVAFGLIGLDLRLAVEAAETGLADDARRTPPWSSPSCSRCAALWMVGAWSMLRRSADVSAAPRTKPRGRGPHVVRDARARDPRARPVAAGRRRRAARPSRRARRSWSSPATVLVATLLLPGFTLPALVRALGVAEDADAEHAAEQVVARRARRAALDRHGRGGTRRGPARRGVGGAARADGRGSARLLRGETADRRTTATGSRRSAGAGTSCSASRTRRWPRRGRGARREPGIDPEAADRVLMRLDLRTVLLD